MPEAVIVSAVRSPIGRAVKGSLRQLRPDDLGTQMVLAALARIPELDPQDIDDLVMGCANPIGESGLNLGRIVAVLAGMDQLPATTVNRYCSSSLQSTRMAFHAIKAGEGSAFISAGVEAVSRYPSSAAQIAEAAQNPVFAPARERSAAMAADGRAWVDPRSHGDLPNVYLAMGQTAENVAQSCGVTRAEQDEFAVRSQNLAEQALHNGFWEREITPVTLPDGTVVRADDGPRHGVTVESVSGLKPVFRPDGTVTAGNCCPLNDGGAAIVVMSDLRAAELGLTPLARIVSTAATGLSPEIMGLGPVAASERALERAGMTMGDVDLIEINEAFAAQVIASARQLGVDPERLNVNGGAIAIGHPFGMTGARITTTLINSLQFHDKHIGLETMCVGGGQGMAMVVERLS